ncbi:MAG TPA: hypothetical protein VGE15_05205 [Sphingobacteriaceae bacterium]
MKRFLFTAAVSFLFLQASGQYKNYNKLSFGLGAGLTNTFTDVQLSGMAQSARLNADFYFTPFITAGLEGQVGSLHGGDATKDRHGREFTNSYKSVFATGKVHLGQFVDYERTAVLNNLKGLYVGTGLGIINNRMSRIVRTRNDGYTFSGRDRSNNILLPLSAGVEYGLDDYWGKTRFIITAGFQFNVAFGEGLDGYDDPPEKFENRMPDTYIITAIGLKYCFGPEGLFGR